MRLLIAVASLALLSACGRQPAGYTQEYEYNFTRACQIGGTPQSVCACVWGKLSAEIPRPEFDAYEALPEAARNTHPMTEKVRGYAAACMPVAPAEPAPAAPR